MNKKQLLNATMILIVSLITLSSCDKEEQIPTEKVPSEIFEYVEKHFPENDIIFAKVEKDNLQKSYEVSLAGGYTLEFNKNKEITEIKGVNKLPDSVIHPNILEYVADNFPDSYIIKWEIDGKNQQVELVNDIELEFTMDGEFIRIDL